MKNAFSTQKLVKTKTLTTRELLVLALIATVFGILFRVWDPVYSLLKVGLKAGTLALFGKGVKEWPIYHLLVGFWFCAGVLGSYILRRPWVAFATEFLAAAVELPMNPRGIFVLGSGLVQGLASEIPFFLTRYKNYRWYVLLIAGALPGITSLPYETLYNAKYRGWEPKIWWMAMLFRVIGGIVFAGGLSKLLGDGLAKAGILSNFPIGKKYLKEV